jgi:hypothetical protein
MKDWFDKNGRKLTAGDIIDIHQTVDGRNLFVVLSLEPLDIRFEYDVEHRYQYDQAGLLSSRPPFDDDPEWEIVGKYEPKACGHPRWLPVYEELDGDFCFVEKCSGCGEVRRTGEATKMAKGSAMLGGDCLISGLFPHGIPVTRICDIGMPMMPLGMPALERALERCGPDGTFVVDMEESVGDQAAHSPDLDSSPLIC